MAESNPEGAEWPTQVDIPENDERWIQDVEGAFDTSKCPEKSWVKFSANLLRGRAKEWWNYTLAAKGPNVA
ncbi:hypothetical protein Tco_0774158 [Tanacetum coccineum]|uniref:Retrotransposon gag domain-containing protein n=1 Tax=Tanacetum coccineum TaxID=301880 RepID=A0ABQ4ZQT7_9ASTR